MEHETLIQLELNKVVDIIFGTVNRDISVHRMPDDSFKVYVTSSDSSFLSVLIGRGGETINSLKHLFYVWAFRNKIKLTLWVERVPIKNHE